MKLSLTSLLAGALILLTIQMLLYYPAVTQGYFHADDWFNFSFYQDYSIGDYALGEWGHGRRGEGGYYRPLSRLYFNANYALYGLWAPGHHLSNFALHFVNVLMLWAVARRLLRSERGAFATALLFLLFPAHPSAVHWISGATDLVHAFWYLAAINLALAARVGEQGGSENKSRPITIIGTLVCFLGALLSKETAAGLPFVILAIEWAALRVSKQNRDQQFNISNILRDFSLTIAAFALLAAYLVFRRIVIGGVGYHVETVMGRGILGPSLLSFLSSLITLISPAWSPANLVAYAIVLGAVFWPLRRSPGGVVAAVWLIMAIAPMAGIIVSIADGGWLLYLPAAAWCVVLVACASIIGNRFIKMGSARRMTGLVALILMIGLYAAGSYIMESRWKLSSILTRYTVESAQTKLADYAASNNLKMVDDDSQPRIPVVIPNLASPFDYPAPIFNPASGLHMALTATVSGPFEFRDFLKDDDTTSTLVFICDLQLMDFPRNIRSFLIWRLAVLYQVQDVRSIFWDGQSMRDSWDWGSGVDLDPELAPDDPLTLATHITNPESGWVQSPPINLSGSTLNLLIMDFNTPIVTEGMISWSITNPSSRPDDRIPKTKTSPTDQLIFNDPISRIRPRHVYMIVYTNNSVISHIQPIGTKGRVDWRGIEWRQYRLRLQDTRHSIIVVP